MLLALLLAVATQDAEAAAVVERMQARAPAIRDLDLRYLARLTVEDEVDFGGETRLALVPGVGLRTDAWVVLLRGSDRELSGLDFEVSAVELGDVLRFRGTVHGGPPMMFGVLPPALALRGSRKDFALGLDAFPADFPFRWVYEDLFPLYALAPRHAFARDPGLRAAGRKALDGRDCLVLEADLPQDRMPPESILRKLPIGAPLKRFFIDAESLKLRRIEVRFEVERDLFFARWEAKSWKDAGGISVPDEVELAMAPEREANRGRIVRIVKKLSSAAKDRGLGEKDLLPEPRRSDVHADGILKPAAFYQAALEKSPRDPSLFASLALARYRDALVAALKPGGREPKLDPGEMIADLQKAQREAPASSFVTTALLRLYEITGRGGEAKALAGTLEGKPGLDADVRLALGRTWAASGEKAKALAAVEGLAPSSLRERLGVVRLRIDASDAKGGAAALAACFEKASPEERRFAVEALTPVPAFRGKREAPPEDKALADALANALAERPEQADLQELGFRNALRSPDSDRLPAALAGFAAAVSDPAGLDRAAALVLSREDGGRPVPYAELKDAAALMARKAPGSGLVLTVHALSLGGGPEAPTRFEEALAAFEKEPPASATPLNAAAKAFADAGREAALLRCCRVYVGLINRSASPWRLTGSGQDALTLCVRDLASRRKLAEIHRALSGLEAEKVGLLGSIRQPLRGMEADFAKAVTDDLLARSKDPKEYRRAATLLQTGVGRPQEAEALLERAREFAPGDVELAWQYGGLCAATNQAEKAAAAYEEVLAAVEKAPRPGMEPERVLWQLASVHQRAARWEKAAAACDRLDLSTPFATNVLPQVGAIYERAGNEKKALEAYRKAVEQDRNPYLAVSNGLHAKLGRILEKAQDFEGAWRIYTKGIEAVARVREQYGETMIPRVARPTEETEVDPGKLRDAMMKRLGADYFVSKLLEKPPMPIEAGVRRRVRELYELLRSDSVAEREDAFAELRKIGPAAAPFVREGLKSTDSEFQARVRRLLVEWSEPR